MERLTHYYQWKEIPEAEMERYFAQFRNCGWHRLVLSSNLLDRIMDEPAFLLRLMRLAEKYELSFPDAHGIWGAALGLGTGGRFPSLIAPMIEAHKRAMAYCADIGCKTYTVHMGAYEHIYFGTPASVYNELAAKALEKLIPEAEKLGLVMALENNCDNPGSADALLPLFETYHSPNFGCCFDTGHAHYLTPAPGREIFIYESGLTLDFCTDPLKKLLPHIVTVHMHDTDRTGDWHRMPGKGEINWSELIQTLDKAPRLISWQSEVETGDYNISIPELVTEFQKLLTIKRGKPC